MEPPRLDRDDDYGGKTNIQSLVGSTIVIKKKKKIIRMV